MDFFAHQDDVRRGSRRLVVLFIAAVIAIVVAVDVVAAWAFGLYGRELLPDGSVGIVIDWQAIALVSVAVAAMIGLACVYRVSSLRGGGAVVARGLGGEPVPSDTADPALRQLRNVIEEIAIASSVPVPDVFWLPNEPGINAFAAGYTPADAAVCVTRGCLEQLDRDELQGVIAHEFSHVLNGDMRLNIRLMGLLFGILFVSTIGRLLMYSGYFGGRTDSRNGNGGAPLALVGIAVMAIGAIGFFFARWIQAAVSRSRESLADASAVQFTRQTTGLTGALKKIAALQAGSQLAAHNKQEVAHMLFGEPGAFSRMFATHPPLPERVRALGGTWDPEEIKRLAATLQAREGREPGMSGGMASAFAGNAQDDFAATAPDVAESAAPIATRAGQPDATDFAAARAWRDALPATLRGIGSDPVMAMVALMAFVVEGDDGDSLRHKQMTTVGRVLGWDMPDRIEACLGDLADIDPRQRLALVTLAFPALRRLPPQRLQMFLYALSDVVQADDRVDLHEYCLLELLKLHIGDLLQPARGHRPGKRDLAQARDAVATVYVAVAAHGHPDDDVAAREALTEGWRLAMADGSPPALVRSVQWQNAFSDALAMLDALRGDDKRRLLEGLAAIVEANGRVDRAETELLRVICATLHCPLPLTVAGESA